MIILDKNLLDILKFFKIPSRTQGTTQNRLLLSMYFIHFNLLNLKSLQKGKIIMNNGYTKGNSKLKITFFKSDTCLKEENGNMTIIRKLFLDGEKSKSFYNEQRELYRQHVGSKVRESVGPIKDATIRELKPILEKLHGDSKKGTYLLTFESYVYDVIGKEVKNNVGKKQLTFNC